MNHVQPNGELKKIYLTKPLDNPTVTNEQTISNTPQWRSMRSYSGDVVRIPPRRHMPPSDKNGEEHLTNHKKQRYWNSWEELHLIELWRRYKDELTIINVPLPVYRKIMIAMRNRNMVVTAQDCRRKINTINSRYKLELQHKEFTGCKSEWRLFPLVHCVLQPKIKEFDPWQENAIIQKLLDKLPKPVEVEVPAPINNNHNINYQTPQTQSLPTVVNINNQPNTSQLYRHTATNLSTTSYTDSSVPYNRISSSQGQLEKSSSILPFRNITADKVEKLRQDNSRLAEQRDANLNSLHMEENNFNCFETFVRIWTEQKESELRRVQGVMSIENGENLKMEQHLHETVVAK